MAKVVGFDFGTHQTKICIADNDDPRNVIYEFLPFHDDLTGKDYFVFPSLIQINEDHTLSYGWSEPERCLMATNPSLMPDAPPIMFERPQKPVLPPMPEEPDPVTKEEAIKLIESINRQRKKRFGRKAKLIPCNEENIIKASLRKTQEREEQFNARLTEWKAKCTAIYAKYEKAVADIDLRNDGAREAYEKAVEEANTPKRQNYTNFKFSTFSGVATRNVLSANQLSLFYITYILFLLEERYGQDFSIQFGVPASPTTYKAQRRLATQILIRAFQLVEDVFHNNMDAFLASSYEDLIALSDLPVFSEEEKENYGIIILPEASACLNSIVASGRLAESKLHLMVDIGGGTTDISFFGVNNHEPKIYWFSSVPYGLNFIRETPDNLSRYVDAIVATINRLKKDLYSDFAETGQPMNYLEDALKGNIIVYNGGGSSETRLCMEYDPFTTIRKIASILPIQFGQKELSKLSHILSNAYGLSYQVDDESQAIKLHPFDRLLKDYKRQVHDAKGTPEHHYKYEHGLSELD